MQVITVTNRKGGTGKTTVATHLAGAFAIMGHHVALIDIDPQGNAGIPFGIHADDALYRVLVKEEDPASNAHRIPHEHIAPPDVAVNGALYLLPSGENSWLVPRDNQNPFALLEAARGLQSAFNLDYVVIDTNPTVNGFDAAFAMATDGYVYVSQAERMSAEGMSVGMKQIARIAASRAMHLNRASSVLAVVPNAVRQKTLVHRTWLEDIHDLYGDKVTPPLRLRTTWPEANTVGELVYTYAPTSTASAEMWTVCELIQERSAAWQSKTG